MKLKLISKITPYLFDGYLIISFDKKWFKKFRKIPTFDVYEDKNGKLIIVGPLFDEANRNILVV